MAETVMRDLKHAGITITHDRQVFWRNDRVGHLELLPNKTWRFVGEDGTTIIENRDRSTLREELRQHYRSKNS